MSHLSNQDFRKLVGKEEEESGGDAVTFSKLSSTQKLNSMKQEIKQVENIKKSRKGMVKKQ